MPPDFNHVGRSDAVRLVNDHADWAADYDLDRDLYRVRHVPSGSTVEVEMWELVRERDKTQVQVKNALIRLAERKLLRGPGDPP